MARDGFPTQPGKAPAQRRIDADTVVFIATALLTFLAFTLIPY